MHRRPLVGTAALSLALALAMPAIPTFAHGGGHGLSGSITAVSPTSITVQTASGPVTTGLTSATVVIKEVTGTVSDLTAGTPVRVTLATGSTTVTSVEIESRPGASARLGGTKTGTAHPKRPAGSTTRPPHTTATPKARNSAGGLVVSAGHGQLVLKGRKGQQTTHTLGQSATISKTATGTLSDLQKGQVRLAPGATSAAAVGIGND